MRSMTTAAAAVALAAALAGTASAAPEGASLKLTRVTSPPASVAVAGDLTVRITVTNKGLRPGGGKVRVFLAGGAKPYDVPRRIGRFTTGKVLEQGFKRFTLRLTIPPNTAPGAYRLRTCLKARGVERCKSSSKFTVTPA